MIVKPLRYKILTGKITDDERHKNRLIFGRHVINYLLIQTLFQFNITFL